MNPYVNEDVMFQRLKDVQREAENRRLLGITPSGLSLLWRLGSGLWATATAALPSAARRRPAIPVEDHQTAEDAA